MSAVHLRKIQQQYESVPGRVSVNILRILAGGKVWISDESDDLSLAPLLPFGLIENF